MNGIYRLCASRVFFSSLFASTLRICVFVRERVGRVALSARVHSRIIVTSLSNPSVCLSPTQSISINTRSPSEGRLYISSLNRTSWNSPKWLALPVWLTCCQNLYAAQRMTEHSPNLKKIKNEKITHTYIWTHRAGSHKLLYVAK